MWVSCCTRMGNQMLARSSPVPLLWDSSNSPGDAFTLSFIFKRDKETLGPETYFVTLLYNSSIFLPTQTGLSSFYLRQWQHSWILSYLMHKLQALSWSRFGPLCRLSAARNFKILLRNPNGDFLKSVFLP